VTVILTNVATGAVSITVTAADGSYLFVGLPAGTYMVTFDPNTLPANVSATTPTSVGVVLAGGDVFLKADFGFTPVAEALPRTGVDNDRIALIGLALAFAGAMLVLGVRVGRRDDDELEAPHDPS
jgi:hypothetical protein